MRTLDFEDIAMVAHETNRAYCAALGDHTQLPWAEAPEWQRRSATLGVSFHMDNPDARPSDSHDSWLCEKTAEGWAWGPEKDPVAKLHPCFVPYEQLPAAQQAKDHLFVAVVRSLLPLVVSRQS